MWRPGRVLVEGAANPSRPASEIPAAKQRVYLPRRCHSFRAILPRMSERTTVQQGLYVHVPFCETKCGYCDFYSVPAAGRDMGPLVDALVQELSVRVPPADGGVTTIFAGGGTPTLLGAEDLSRLMAPLKEVASCAGCVEFTVEANPATLDAAKAKILVQAGVDRLSLGAQSFHPSELAVLERIHSPDDIAPAVRIARDFGIDRLNIDLIFGIPGQTLASWAASLRQALDLNPDHLSLYGLTYEPGTPLTHQRNRGRVKPCDDGLEADMYLAAGELLADNGFEQYEISNYAKPGQECKHNLLYWSNAPYIGVGPSAVGSVGGVRYRNVNDVGRYTRAILEDGDAVTETEKVCGKVLAAETAMLRLRLSEGIDCEEFERHTGFDPKACFAASIQQYQELALIQKGTNQIALTPKGRLYADTIITDFMAELENSAECKSVPLRLLPG